VTDDRSVVDYTIPRQARSNFGLGEWLTGGLNLSGVGPSGLVSELRVREFDSIYTHREPVDSLLLRTTAPGAQDSLLQEIGARRLAAEIQSGRKLTWNLMAAASDYTELGRPEKSLETLDWGIGIVGPVPSADLLATKAKLLFAQGRSADAREALSRALALDPTHAQALKLAAEFQP
jgi:tetratricopeptide (TPR) repeat protein